MSEPSQRPSATSPLLPQNLATAALRINEELARRSNKKMSLTRQAQTELEVLHAEYLGDLGQKAIRLARRDHLATIDREHVLQAATRLGIGKTNSATGNVLTTFGGLLAGAALAGAYQIYFGPGPHSTAESLAVILLAASGFFLLAFGMALWVKRK